MECINNNYFYLVDADLSHKLNEELKYEKEEGDSEISEEMKAYIDKMPFKITDKKGEDEIHLTRTFGNETINVIFSIKDVDVAAPELDAEEGDEESIPNPPIHATIDITKSGSGTITFNTVIEDGYFNIDLVTYYKDDKLAIEDGAEAEWKRHALYGGPVFNDLEEDLQILFEKYLEERGISTDLALFIPNYIQFKEQKEYMNWLASVHDFVKA
ncbi:mitochondrial glycoprotein [Neoconidiobolus thromboides FSU 785]|nr:mitochondrial glycoprotein [Neoconidiobolus thromboides FSU 785]